MLQDLKNTLKSKESIVLLYTAFALVCIHFIGDIRKIQITDFRMWMAEGVSAEFKQLAWWTSINLVFYLILPILIVHFVFKEHLLNYGFKFSKYGSNKIYLLFFVGMVPLVFLASKTAGFQLKYPFYHLNIGEKLWPWFVFWEILYFFQFLGLEFFFRGFMVLGLKKKMGMQSILIMTVPYCMVHFTKPMPEAVASIFAGLALGYLSYKKGSIIPGAILHFGVALTMDLMSLWQKGLL